MTIGERIKQLRLSNNENVLALAEYLHTSVKVIYNIESNLSEPNIDVIIKIKHKYKVDYEYLLEGIE